MTSSDIDGAVDISPEVARDLHAEALARAHRSVVRRLGGLAVAVPLWMVFSEGGTQLQPTLAVVILFLAIAAGASARELFRLQRVTPLESFRHDYEEESRRKAFRAEHEVRLAAVRAWMTYSLAGSIALVFVGEFRFASITEVVARAGMVKPAVLSGEWWRLVTASCLHASVGHLAGNVGALLALGTLVEAYDRRMRVPLVYLAAVVGGSLASLALSNQSGIGASGGILGLAGYLVVRARQGRLPGPIEQSILRLLAVTALVGLVGHAFIGNAAHAGGALTGAAIAYVTGSEEISSPEPALDALGWLTLAAVLGAAAFTWTRLMAAA